MCFIQITRPCRLYLKIDPHSSPGTGLCPLAEKDISPNLRKCSPGSQEWPCFTNTACETPGSPAFHGRANWILKKLNEHSPWRSQREKCQELDRGRKGFALFPGLLRSTVSLHSFWAPSFMAVAPTSPTSTWLETAAPTGGERGQGGIRNACP